MDSGVSWLRVLAEPDDRPGWVRCSDLLAEPARLVDWQVEVADTYSGVDDGGRLTGSGLVLDWYLAAVTLPAAGMFHLDRRVPHLSPDSVLLRRVPGGTTVAVALESSQFCCLVDDPAADQPGQVMADIAGLAAVLRAEVVDHAERLLTAYATTTRIGRHGRWGAVTDALDVAFLTGGWVSGDSTRASADARLVLGEGDGQLVGGSTLHEIVDDRGRRHWTRRRYSCCFLYRAPDGGVCVTCPRVSDEERRRQAASW